MATQGSKRTGTTRKRTAAKGKGKATAKPAQGAAQGAAQAPSVLTQRQVRVLQIVAKHGPQTIPQLRVHTGHQKGWAALLGSYNNCQAQGLPYPPKTMAGLGLVTLTKVNGKITVSMANAGQTALKAHNAAQQALAKQTPKQ